MMFKPKLAMSVSEVYNTFAVRLRTGVVVRSWAAGNSDGDSSDQEGAVDTQNHSSLGKPSDEACREG